MTILLVRIIMTIMRDNPMDKKQLFSLLQFAGGTFPTGAFSQSWGLETYVATGKVYDLASFHSFLLAYIQVVLAHFEGPILCRAYQLTKLEATIDYSRLAQLEELATAMRLTRESREASHRTGKALIRIASTMLDREDLNAYYDSGKDVGINYPVAFGMLAALMEVSEEEALAAFVFSAVNAVVQSGVKLIPLGNGEAQKLILQSYESIGRAVEEAMATPFEGIYSFCPAFDLASIHHEELETRLYMS
jgi:urease accessory protein